MNDETLGRHTVNLSTCKILLVEDLHFLCLWALSCSNYAQSAIIWCNWVLFRPITTQTSLVWCLYYICRFCRRHITTTLWALYAVTSKWLPVFFTHAWFPFSFTVWTMYHTWPYIFQLLTSSPTRFLCLDANRKTPPQSPSDSVFLPTVFFHPRPSPTALTPCFPSQTISNRVGPVSSTTTQITPLTTYLLHQQSVDHWQLRILPTSQHTSQQTTFTTDRTTPVMLMSQSLLHVMCGRHSRPKNREHASSVHVSLSSLPQGDHQSNLRITGAYMFRIFVISDYVTTSFPSLAQPPTECVDCLFSFIGHSFLLMEIHAAASMSPAVSYTSATERPASGVSTSQKYANEFKRWLQKCQSFQALLAQHHWISLGLQKGISFSRVKQSTSASEEDSSRKGGSDHHFFSGREGRVPTVVLGCMRDHQTLLYSQNNI
jgi:hypothetical protein